LPKYVEEAFESVSEMWSARTWVSARAFGRVLTQPSLVSLQSFDINERRHLTQIHAQC